MDYWNFRCRQPRFVLKKHKLDLIEAPTCQFIADNGNGTAFQRLDCPARRTHADPRHPPGHRLRSPVVARLGSADRRLAGPLTEVDLPCRRSEWRGSF
jgi:hypothetical protein